MRHSKAGRFAVPGVVALALLGALGSTTPANAEVPPALTSEPLRMLSSHGRWWGIAISGPDGSRPIGRPQDFWLAFGTITDYGEAGSSEGGKERAALFWESDCNEVSYKLNATPTRFLLSGEGSTLVKCFGPAAREERWLERFFDADPHWRLVGPSLVLAAHGGRIVLGHRRPRSG